MSRPASTESTHEYPFLFVHHGVVDPEYLDKAEELFVWFRDPVPPSLREEIFRDCPSPVASPYHWDREFCYFGSPGDTYDWAVRFDYAPPDVRATANAGLTAGPKAWKELHRQIEKHLDASVRRFSEDFERWALRVHSIAPIAAVWGPHGTPDDDPWHRWSLARFSETMQPRLAAYVPDARGGRQYLGWIRDLCADLIVIAPPTKKAKRSGSARGGAVDETASIATLDESARRHRPRSHVSRLSYPEHDLLVLGEQVARFVGKGRDARTRLARLAPLTQLTFLAGYDAEHFTDGDPDLPRRVRSLVEALAADERGSAVPLLTMLAQTLAHDTPAFDRPRRQRAAQAAEVLRQGFDQPGIRAATYARAARYLRWAGKHAGSRALAEQGIARFGERRTLLRAAMKAAARQGDERAAAAYGARLEAVLSKGSASP